jgi:hypothetical protein
MFVSRRTLLAIVPVAALAATSSAALAKTMSFNVPLSGAQQVPPVQTSGSGTAHLTYNSANHHVSWTIHYSNLSSPVTMAHFHHAPEGKNGPVVIWLTKKGAPVSSPITGHATLTSTQAKEFMAGDMYINVHTKDHPAGEIRGQVMPK